MNIIQSIFDHLYDCIGNSDPRILAFLIHCFLLFGLATLLPGVAFYRGNRSVFIQVLFSLVGVLIASVIPVERIEITNRVAKTWAILFLLITLVVLPHVLASLLTPKLGAQRRIQAVAMGLMVILFLANYLFMKGWLWND
jgi:hypothetical protein